jgi:hypothetical protein
MLKSLSLTLAAALLLLSAQPSVAGNQVFKCVVNGSVTFQSSPCPAEKPSRHPTKEELNAERKKRLTEESARAASAPKPATPQVPITQPHESVSATQAPPREPAYRCDGRTYCSQMRSCSEAKFFLANCPGVKMDGNRDGTPCEQQWCTHPFAK